ncbi:uracil-DNA glycosylase family protein [Maritimibacter sp. DP1N21-5]|uniref:uracil-DNA glycosylase n=1 Tax=Maritimibacter sp. DP1N21-5 TaxID=2836867 RepID=UPI001C445C42|nr:uracil-DNA glycosylase [Maritimibacter sp. DP1N21-5]MBV7407628.1 uracil-DNA glycosylase [Maritimibacter sp. DP1N21-5]
MESALDWHQAKALLDWYVELGVTDTVGDAPINRYELEAQAPKHLRVSAAVAPAQDVAPEPQRVDWVAEARRVAASVDNLETLAQAMQDFEGCELKRGARNFVFADGMPAARVMVVGDAPGPEEDRDARPFVGREGTLFDAMFAAIGLKRDVPDAEAALYALPVIPYRTPSDRVTHDGELEMFRPFLARHVFLADPDVIVAMGSVAARALTGASGIKRARGRWATFEGKPVMPMFHPRELLRAPQDKKAAWADLLEVQARLRSGA